MALDPLAISVQGVGFGPLLTAAQGLLDAEAVSAAALEGSGGHRLRRRFRRNVLTFDPFDEVEEDNQAALRLLGMMPGHR